MTKELDPKDWYNYDPITGIVTWKKRRANCVQIGDVVGSKSSDGYLKTKLGAASYSMHRIAWYLTYGAWPEGEIDHINRIRHDNRLENLRESTRTQNRINQPNFNFGANRSKHRWFSFIKKDGVRYWLGMHDTEEQAQNAYKEKFKELHGHEPEGMLVK